MQTYPATSGTVDILSEQNDVIFLDAASNWQRLANWIIDLVAFYLVVFVVLVFVGIGIMANGSESSFEAIDQQGDMFWNLIFVVSYVLFMTILEGITRGRSLGKWITRTKVTTVAGEPIGFRPAFLRSISRLVPFEALSIFFGGTPWHDSWTNTQVIKMKRSY